MPQDKNTAGYRMKVTLEFTEVNKYGDTLGDGSLTFTRVLEVPGLTGLTAVLEQIDSLGPQAPIRFGIGGG